MEQNRTLLIVDDEENMRHMLQAMVNRHGYSVETAVDGQDALNKIARKHFDFILCDIRMPNMDGIAFLQEAGTRIQTSTVIMMSAYGTIDMALEAIKAGAYDFISKPFKSRRGSAYPEKSRRKREPETGESPAERADRGDQDR